MQAASLGLRLKGANVSTVVLQADHGRTEPSFVPFYQGLVDSCWPGNNVVFNLYKYLKTINNRANFEFTGRSTEATLRSRIDAESTM